MLSRFNYPALIFRYFAKKEILSLENTLRSVNIFHNIIIRPNNTGNINSKEFPN